MPTIEDYKRLTLSSLYHDGLTIRAVRCCDALELNSLYDILVYFIKTQDFLSAENSGLKTATELNDLCIINFNALNEDEKNNLLNETLSQYTINSCQLYNRLTKISKLESFLLQNDIKSSWDLIKYLMTNNLLVQIQDISVIKIIVKNYREEFVTSIQNQSFIEDGETYIIPQLDEEKLSFIKSFFKKTVSNASARIRHVFGKYEVQDFLKFNNESFLTIDNIGKTCLPELCKIQKKIISFIDKIQDATNSEIQYYHVIDTYGIDNAFVTDFYEQNGRLPMFWIIEQYYQTHIKERSMNIYTMRFPIKKDFTYDEAFLEEIGSNYGIVRERARQIAVHVFDDLKSFPIIHQDWEWYKEALLDKQHFAGSDILKGVLEHENSSFSCEFALQILCWVYENQYDYVGHSIKEWKKKDYWNLKLIVEKKIVQSFDFDLFYFEYKKKKEKFGKDTWCNIDEICMPYMKTQDWEIRATIPKIVGYIFASDTDFDLTVVGNKVMFPAEREQKPNDIIYDILQEAKRPMHIAEIFDRFKELYPDHKYEDSNQLRGWLQRDERFTFLNRKSTYLLKEWDYYSGTKGNAIAEFLEQTDAPQSLKDITDYVSKCFPDSSCNTNNISSLIYADAQKRFEKYKGGLYGLKGKEYSADFVQQDRTYAKRFSFEERLEQLREFIKKNNRIPGYNLQDTEELSLKRWMANIERGTIETTETQKEQYNNLKESCA